MSGFQERLKSARQRLGLTQEALAEELNVTKASVSAWETGREKPGFRLLPRLRIVLGTSLDDLICGGDTDGEPPEGDRWVARNDDETTLLKAYRKLPAKRRRALLDLLGKP
ncbi:MAG: helix-turn-helix transcriptional regulator [Alcanivorax sp.]|jgi:transcriptional regulator with XRE-family HTH domain|nr:helix-turn-helix transcriptional regulator [Alcanivorax sp.]